MENALIKLREKSCYIARNKNIKGAIEWIDTIF